MKKIPPFCRTFLTFISFSFPVVYHTGPSLFGLFLSSYRFISTGLRGFSAKLLRNESVLRRWTDGRTDRLLGGGGGGGTSRDYRARSLLDLLRSTDLRGRESKLIGCYFFFSFFSLNVTLESRNSFFLWLPVLNSIKFVNQFICFH